MPPVYREVLAPTGPLCEVTGRGEMQCRDLQRSGVDDMAAYVREMHVGVPMPTDSELGAKVDERRRRTAVPDVDALADRVVAQLRGAGAGKAQLDGRARARAARRAAPRNGRRRQ